VILDLFADRSKGILYFLYDRQLPPGIIQELIASITSWGLSIRRNAEFEVFHERVGPNPETWAERTRRLSAGMPFGTIDDNDDQKMWMRLDFALYEILRGIFDVFLSFLHTFLCRF